MLLRFFVGLLVFALACAAIAAALGRRETATRCLTLAGLVTLLSGAMALGMWGFAVLLALTAELISRELGELDQEGGGQLGPISLGLLLLVLLVPPIDPLIWALAGSSLVAASTTARLLLSGPRESVGVPALARTLLATHAGVGLAALALMFRTQPNLLLATIVMMQFSDGFAYLVGRKWGRTKLAAQLSPNKTVEGLLGGAAACAVVLGICHTPLFPALRGGSWLHAVGLWVIVVGLGVLGDLLYSLAKRRAALDDYGSSLPGHGGVLDRLDSLLASAPVILAWHLLVR